jgi:hypothetical protein
VILKNQLYCEAPEKSNASEELTGYSVISGFRRVVDENCALLSYLAASIGNFFQSFWILDPEDRTKGLCRNVSKKLPLLGA